MAPAANPREGFAKLQPDVGVKEWSHYLVPDGHALVELNPSNYPIIVSNCK